MFDYFISYLDDVRSLFNVHRIFLRASMLHKFVLYLVSVKCFATPDCRFSFLVCPVFLYSLGFVTFILADVTFYYRLVESFILIYFHFS